MKRELTVSGLLVMAVCVLGLMPTAFGQSPPVSDLTQECLDCHVSATPAVVEDWKRSRHSKTTFTEAARKPELQRRVSAGKVPDRVSDVVVGCAECHMLNPDAHKETFDHNDQKVHLLVTPKDCATCHTTEADQYQKNLMSHARTNLADNTLYQSLMKAVNGPQTIDRGKASLGEPDTKTGEDSCWHCHGTVVEVKGKRTRSTDYGELEFPELTGWPNQGVGRYNTDGSKGSCSPCHSRHEFPIQAARKPYTCSQCHKGPDVPAYRAYSVSKHANLFSALEKEWSFTEVPWTVGKDFVAPTCAVCHVSLVVSPEGTVVAKRTHEMADRLPWRVLGLIYSHPHPTSPDTSVIRNEDGVPLATTLDGKPAADFLISPDERQKRKETLHKVCLSCHTRDWVNGHWERFENTLKTADAMTLTATEVMKQAWDEKLADPANLFDEAIEKKWVEHWLFYGNSTRFASAMVGADYGVFDNGRWFQSKNVQEMLDYVRFLRMTQKKGR